MVSEKPIPWELFMSIELHVIHDSQDTHPACTCHSSRVPLLSLNRPICLILHICLRSLRQLSVCASILWCLTSQGSSLCRQSVCNCLSCCCSRRCGCSSAACTGWPRIALVWCCWRCCRSRYTCHRILGRKPVSNCLSSCHGSFT